MNAMKLAVPYFVALAYGPPQGLATPSLSGSLDFGASLLGLGLLRRRKLRPAKRSFERISPTVPLMKANCDVFSERSGVLSSGTLLVLLALGGCAGGGGGGGGASPAGFSYPSSLTTAKSTDTVGGFVSPYALNSASNQLVSVPQAVFAVGAATGKLTLTVSAFQLPSGEEPAFVVTFDPASSPSLLANSPLDSLSPNCIDCLKTVTALATSGGASAGTVTFTYLDPAKLSLNYSTFGMWSKPSMSSSGTEVGGTFSAGVLTRGIDLPTTGTASYNGFFIGRYATSDTTAGYPAVGTYVVGANAHADVNFGGTGAVTTFSTSNTQISQEIGGGTLAPPILEQRLDLHTTAPMPITRTSTSNSFVGGPGTLTTSGFGMTGEIKGGFYGPPAGATAPPELGGALAVASGTQTMVGSFGLKKQ
jgi:hypothetical protein